jgi:hypothetical protein
MATGALIVGILAAAKPARATSIVNGGFETGNFDGWTVTPASSNSVIYVGGKAHSGFDAAWFGAMGSHDDSLSQTLDTTAGTTYTITFWLRHGATDAWNDFSVWWDSTPLLILTNAAKFGQTQYTFVATAADDSSVLRFSGRERLDFYYLDDVSVTALEETAIAAVANPEPATLLMVLTGLAVAGRARAVRRRRSVKSEAR